MHHVAPAVYQFSEDTTIHGIQYFAGYGRATTARVIWITLFLGSIGLCYFVAKGSIVAYLNFDVKTITRTESLSSQNENFPAITFCSHNTFRRTIVGASPQFYVGTLMGLFHYSFTQMKDMCEYNQTNNLTPSLNNPTQFFTERGITAMSQVAHDSTQSVVQCAWEGNVIPCASIFLNHMTDSGWCFTFNFSPETIRNFISSGAKINGISTGINNLADYTIKSITNTGLRSGLSLLLNARQNDSCDGGMYAALGFMAVLHEPDVEPMLKRESPILLEPGKLTSVAIKPRRIVRKTANLNRCSEKVSLRYYPDMVDYKRQACYQECYVNLTVRNCGCFPWYAPPKFIEQNDLTVTPPCLDEIGMACLTVTETTSALQPLARLCKMCAQPCKETSYDVEVSSSKFPAPNLARALIEQLNLNVGDPSEVEKNYLRVLFYIKELYFNIIEESLAMEIEDLLANIGGVVSLFLGMSVLSLFELGHLVASCVVLYCSQRGKKVPVEKADRWKKPISSITRQSSMVNPGRKLRVAGRVSSQASQMTYY